MASAHKTYTVHLNEAPAAANRLRRKYERLMQQLDFGYFAFISFCIAFSACLGGGLVRFSLQYNSALWQFILGMCLSLVNIIACVALLPVRWIFFIFLVSTFANVALILISVFA